MLVKLKKMQLLNSLVLNGPIILLKPFLPQVIVILVQSLKPSHPHHSIQDQL